MIRLLTLTGILALSACASTGETTGNPIVAEMQAMEDGGRVNSFDVPDAVIDDLLPDSYLLPDEYDPAEERFDIEVTNLDVHDFYRSLVQDTPYSVAVDPRLTGTVSLSLKNVTIDEVMQLARDMHGYEYRLRNNLYQVYPGTLVTRI